MEKLLLEPYNKEWPLKFQDEKKQIYSLFGSDVIYEIHHVGSTAIPGLKAKPIIDIAIEIHRYPPSQTVVDGLIKLEYKHLGECDVPGRHWFIKGSPRKFHLHLTPINGEVTLNLLKFRDVLRQYPDLQKEYLAIKEKFHGHFELDSHA